jgi:hypothetical protein
MTIAVIRKFPQILFWRAIVGPDPCTNHTADFFKMTAGHHKWSSQGDLLPEGTDLINFVSHQSSPLVRVMIVVQLKCMVESRDTTGFPLTDTYMLLTLLSRTTWKLLSQNSSKGAREYYSFVIYTLIFIGMAG